MSSRKLPIPYKYSILIGFAVGVLFALKTYLMYLYWDEMEYYTFKRHALVPVVNYTLWGLLMPVAYYFISRFKVGSAHSAGENLFAFGASLLMSVIHEVTSNIIYFGPMHLFGIEPFTGETWTHITSSFPSALINRLIEYWILYAVVSGLEFQKKYRDKQIELAQMESKLAGAQLSALRLQLHPHFLFNTLNTISSLMEIDVKDAQGIVSKLGNLLRTVLDTNKRNLVELREELDFVKSYLDIEQVRFQDRLAINYDVQPETLNCLVPSLILQPLVENAIKHGLAKKPGKGVISVKAGLQKNCLRISVRDDGRGSSLPRQQLLSSGTGLRNISERLALLYQDSFTLDIQTQPEKGFAVSLMLPCQKARS